MKKQQTKNFLRIKAYICLFIVLNFSIFFHILNPILTLSIKDYDLESFINITSYCKSFRIDLSFPADIEAYELYVSTKDNLSKNELQETEKINLNKHSKNYAYIAESVNGLKIIPNTQYYFYLFIGENLIYSTQKSTLEKTIYWTDKDHYDIEWYSKNKDSDSFEINTASELAGLAFLNNNNICDFKNKTIKLQSDIDLKEYSWEPIGSYGDPFAGQFDGNNKKIINLHINEEEKDFQGLFGCTYNENALIKNIQLSDSYIIGQNHIGGIVGNNQANITGDTHNSIIVNNSTILGNEQVGGIIGSNNNDIQIDYCKSIDCCISGKSDVGGIVGFNRSGNISMCVNKSLVTSYSRIVGGVVGNNRNGHISKSHNSGDIKNTGFNSGGIAGLNNGSIEYCYNEGEISGLEMVAGIAGSSSFGSIKFTKNQGKIQGNKFVGGISGHILSESSKIEFSTNNAHIQGQLYVGGITGFCLNGIINATSNTASIDGFDFVGGIVGKSDNGIISNNFNSNEVNGQNFIGPISGDSFKNEFSLTNYSSSTNDLSHLSSNSNTIEDSSCFIHPTNIPRYIFPTKTIELLNKRQLLETKFKEKKCKVDSLKRHFIKIQDELINALEIPNDASSFQ